MIMTCALQVVIKRQHSTDDHRELLYVDGANCMLVLDHVTFIDVEYTHLVKSSLGENGYVTIITCIHFVPC